jgi:hypothetical protein
MPAACVWSGNGGVAVRHFVCCCVQVSFELLSSQAGVTAPPALTPQS